MFAVASLRESLSTLAPGLRVADVGLLATAGRSTWVHLLSAPGAVSGVVSSTLVAGGALLAAGFVLRANVRLTALTAVSAVATVQQSGDGLGSKLIMDGRRTADSRAA